MVGIISFVGTPTWTLALVLPEETAPKMAEKFVGFDIPFGSPDMGDMVGELANVLSGEVIAQLDARGVKAQMSLPMVMRGHDLETVLPRGTPELRLGYTLPQGHFCCQVTAPKNGQLLGRKPGN